MSDVRHYVRAREHLENDMTEASHDGATLNAQLAVSVAVREICGELRNSLQGLNSRLQDVATALDTDANLVQVADVFISLGHVVAVGPDPESPDARSFITLVGGLAYPVDRPAAEVAMKLGVSL